MNWDEEHDAMVKKLDEMPPPGIPLWVDMALFVFIMCVAGWLAYMIITAP
jgi:hypothetical protein